MCGTPCASRMCRRPWARLAHRPSTAPCRLNTPCRPGAGCRRWRSSSRSSCAPCPTVPPSTCGMSPGSSWGRRAITSSARPMAFPRSAWPCTRRRGPTRWPPAPPSTPWSRSCPRAFRKAWTTWSVTTPPAMFPPRCGRWSFRCCRRWPWWSRSPLCSWATGARR